MDSLYENEVLKAGFYSKPHGLITMVQDKYISKSEYILMDILMSFENRHVKDMAKGGVFYCSDETICKTRLLSPKSIVKARRDLSEKGLIDYKKGYTHHATEYRILIDKKYYFKTEVQGKNTVK